MTKQELKKAQAKVKRIIAEQGGRPLAPGESLAFEGIPEEELARWQAAVLEGHRQGRR